MRKAYMLIYSDSLGSRNEIRKCLNSLEVIDTWRYDMPNSFYVISEHSASEIAKEIRRLLGNGRFLLTEISDNRQGWLTSQSWYLIKNKKVRK